MDTLGNGVTGYLANFPEPAVGRRGRPAAWVGVLEVVYCANAGSRFNMMVFWLRVCRTGHVDTTSMFFFRFLHFLMQKYDKESASQYISCNSTKLEQSGMIRHHSHCVFHIVKKETNDQKQTIMICLEHKNAPSHTLYFLLFIFLTLYYRSPQTHSE